MKTGRKKVKKDKPKFKLFATYYDEEGYPKKVQTSGKLTEAYTKAPKQESANCGKMPGSRTALLSTADTNCAMLSSSRRRKRTTTPRFSE